MQLSSLMVTTKFPPDFGGAAVQATYLAEQLQRRGVDIQFIADNGAKKTVDEVYKGLRVHRFTTFGEFLQKESMFQYIVYLWKVYWFILTHPQYRIVHFHSLRGYEALLFPFIKILGRKILLKLTLVGVDDPMALKKRKSGVLFLIGLKSVDRFVAISTKLKELAIKAGVPEHKVRIIYNGTNTNRFKQISAEEKIALKERLELDKYNRIFFFSYCTPI